MSVVGSIPSISHISVFQIVQKSGQILRSFVNAAVVLHIKCCLEAAQSIVYHIALLGQSFLINALGTGNEQTVLFLVRRAYFKSFHFFEGGVYLLIAHIVGTAEHYVAVVLVIR